MRLKFNDLSLVVATCTVAHCGLSKWNASILGCELLTTTFLVYYCTLIIEWCICKAFIDFDVDCFSVLMRKYVLAFDKEFMRVWMNWYVLVLAIITLFMVACWILYGNHYCSDGAYCYDTLMYIT